MATLSTAARNAAVDAVVVVLEAAGVNPVPRLAFRTGGTFVASYEISDTVPCWGAAASGTASLLVSGSVRSQAASGTPGDTDGYSLNDRNNDAVFFQSLTGVGLDGSGLDIEVGVSVNVAAGQLFRLDSLVITMPES